MGEALTSFDDDDPFEESTADYTALEDGDAQNDDGRRLSFEDNGDVEEPIVTTGLGSVGTELREFLKLAWPVALTSIIEFIPSLVSIAFVGRFCDRSALDGAALGTMYFNIAALSIGLGLTTALDTLAPQAVGAGKPKLLGVYVQRGGLVLAVALVPLVLMAAFAGEILQGLGQPPTIAHRAGEYVRWNLFSLPCYWVRSPQSTPPRPFTVHRLLSSFVRSFTPSVTSDPS